MCRWQTKLIAYISIIYTHIPYLYRVPNNIRIIGVSPKKIWCFL